MHNDNDNNIDSSDNNKPIDAIDETLWMTAVYADGGNNQHPDPEYEIQQAPKHISALAVLVYTLAC